jgi:hypothetical protein
LIQKKECIGIFILPLVLCISCLHSRSTTQSFARHAKITIVSGKAIVKIDGQVNENLYPEGIFDTAIKDEKYYDNPIIQEGTITKNETKNMIAGEEYTFSILPTEVVIINITSLDGNDVEVTVYQYGREKKHIIKGTNKLGLLISFQNR